MTRRRLAPERAFRLFADAVVAFADDPGPENLERYLAASRRLEESRHTRKSPSRARPRVAAARGDAA